MIKCRSAAAVFALGVAACASVDVRTASSPDADLGALRTFNVMPQPEPGPAPGQDPVLGLRDR